MTDKEALKLALDALEGVLDDAPKVLDASISGGLYEVVQCRDAITALKERLEAPMREVQRLGQEIEQEPICPACKAEVLYECVACSNNNYPPKRTEHITDGSPCWCEPELDYKDPDTGAEVWIHRETQ